MDYENTSYAAAKQLIKVAEPPAPTAPAGGSSWLSELPGKLQASYAGDMRPLWQMGIGGLGGAGLGALSSLWQPKRRKNPLGRTLTGGLLGALAGGAYNLIEGAGQGYENEGKRLEHQERMEQALSNLDDEVDRSNVYGPGGSNTAWEQTQEGIKGLGEGKIKPIIEAVKNRGGVESVGEDISSALAGKTPQYNYLPEVGGGAAALAYNRFRNRATGIGGRRGPLGEQMKIDVGKLNPAIPGGDVDAAIRAETAGRKALGSRNPLNRKFWTGSVPEAYQSLLHGSRARRVLSGVGTLNNAASNAWSPYYPRAKKNLKAVRGGPLKRGLTAGIIALIADLAIRAGLESGTVSGRGATRSQANYLDSLGALRQANAKALELTQSR